VIPIRSETRPRGRSIIVWLAVAGCTAALVRLALMPDESATALIDALAVVPGRLLQRPFDPVQILTLVTSVFLHAGWFHLVSNMLYLLVFGPLVEVRLGWRSFAALYLGAGAVGALLHALVHPSSLTPLVGASGAIAGVLGAHLVLEPRSRITTVIPIVVFFELATLPAAFVIAVWFLMQVASAVAPVTAAAQQAPVAWFAHFGGFAVGAAVGAVATAMEAGGSARLSALGSKTARPLRTSRHRRSPRR